MRFGGENWRLASVQAPTRESQEAGGEVWATARSKDANEREDQEGGQWMDLRLDMESVRTWIWRWRR